MVFLHMSILIADISHPMPNIHTGKAHDKPCLHLRMLHNERCSDRNFFLDFVPNFSMIGLVSICGCCTMRVGQRKLRPEVSVASEEYKKQFQTSKANMGRGRMERDISGNFSASEYCNWRKKERVHHGRNIGETTFGC